VRYVNDRPWTRGQNLAPIPEQRPGSAPRINTVTAPPSDISLGSGTNRLGSGV
jgi:hypothetical protein